MTVIERLLLWLILTGYLILGGMFALRTPNWQAPDEPAHYNYIAQVAAYGCCPMIEPGDWQQDYQNELIGARFAPELLGRLDTIQYEDHQPPLYYLLASLVYTLTNGSLLALRLLSVLLGAALVLCTYLIGKVVYPAQPGIALGAAALVAFVPQHTAMLAAANNDSLAELLIAVTLLATLVYMRPDDQPATRFTVHTWMLGLLVGVIFITKSTGYFMAGVVPLAILLRWWPQRQQVGIGRLVRDWAAFLVPALILGGIWWLRNIGIYGFPDFLGLRQHDLVVADQPRTAEIIAANGFSVYARGFIHTAFNSFWGQFGWMAWPLQAWMYSILQLTLIGAGIGLLIEAFMRRPMAASESVIAYRRRAWIILLVVLALTLLAFIYYNTEFYQPQGRYLFPGLVPFGLLIALGLDAWQRRLPGHWPLTQWLPVLAIMSLAVFDFYLIWRVLPPLLTP